MAVITTRVPDIARNIAIDYWRRTPHVFRNSYPEKTSCSFCNLPLDSDNRDVKHVLATARPAPTVAEVLQVFRGAGYEFKISPSCGHVPSIQRLHDRRHKPVAVGTTFDCWTCETTWQDANFPGLPDEIVERINALIPRCPMCREPVRHLPFLVHADHDVLFEIDGSSGDLNGSSDHHDTLDEQPDWVDETLSYLPAGWQTGELEVGCDNDHAWITRRLAWKHEGGAHEWRIISEDG